MPVPELLENNFPDTSKLWTTLCGPTTNGCPSMLISPSSLQFHYSTFHSLTYFFVRYSNNPKGTINYVPAFPGAKYGNMSVCFGEDTQGPEPFTPAQVLDGMVAYTGPYLLFSLFFLFFF